MNVIDTSCEINNNNVAEENFSSKIPKNSGTAINLQ